VEFKKKGKIKILKVISNTYHCNNNILVIGIWDKNDCYNTVARKKNGLIPIKLVLPSNKDQFYWYQFVGAFFWSDLVYICLCGISEVLAFNYCLKRAVKKTPYISTNRNAQCCWQCYKNFLR